MSLMVFITFRAYTLRTDTPYTIIPSKYSKRVPWNVTIIQAPDCPPVPQIYLIKTSPYNFELRQLSRLMLKKQGGVTAFFVIGLRDGSSGGSETG